MADLVSSDKVLEIASRGYKEVIKYNWHGEIILIRCYLSREEEWRVIHSILNTCSVENDGAKYIIPEMLDFVARTEIVAAYSNVELPRDIEERHKILYCSDIYDVISKHSNSDQINNIFSSIKMYLQMG